jgi:hypothetical protein
VGINLEGSWLRSGNKKTWGVGSLRLTPGVRSILKFKILNRTPGVDVCGV